MQNNAQARGQRLGWECREEALEKEVSSFADRGQVKFVGSHVDISGIVVVVDSDQTPDSCHPRRGLSNVLSTLGL